MWRGDDDRYKSSGPVEWLSVSEGTVVTHNSTYSLGKMWSVWATHRAKYGLSMDIEYVRGDPNRGYKCTTHIDKERLEQGEAAKRDALLERACRPLESDHAGAQDGEP